MTAYEVSVCKLAAYENADEFDVDAEFGMNFEGDTLNIENF